MGKGMELFGALLGTAAAAAVESAAAKAEYNNRLQNAAMRIKLDIATEDDWRFVMKEVKKNLQSQIEKDYRRFEQLTSEINKIAASIKGIKTICDIADNFKNDVTLDEFLIKDNNGELLLRLVKCDCDGTEIIKAYTDTDEEYDLADDYRRYEKAKERLTAAAAELKSLKDELSENTEFLQEIIDNGY